MGRYKRFYLNLKYAIAREENQTNDLPLPNMSTLVTCNLYFIVIVGSLISGLVVVLGLFFFGFFVCLFLLVQNYFSFSLFCSHIFCFYFWVWQWKTNEQIINHSHPLLSLWFKCLKFLGVCLKSYLFGLILIYLQTSFCFFSNYVHLFNFISRGHDHSFILCIASFHDFITLLLWNHTCSGKKHWYETPAAERS